jgi:dolichol-phosphate mannosyltransferase
MKSISFIVPAYNEEKTIATVLEKLIKLDVGLEKEIIVVDDGSKDKTLEIVKKIKEESNSIILIASHNTNYGKGRAINTGFKKASGDIVTIQDADLEYNLEDFKRLVKPLVQGKTKVVYGSRFLKKNAKGYSLFYIGNKFLSLMTSIIYFRKITDMETCYKLFSREVVKDLNIQSDGFALEPEITSKILKKGYKILELPIDYFPRNKKEGKKIKISDGFKALWTLIKYRFR